MAFGDTNFNSVVVSDFLKMTPVLTADLPAAAATNAGWVAIVSDNGVGDDETAMVISNGTAWTLTTGAALT